MEKPKCYQCVHRLEIAGSVHSRCNNHDANVTGSERGVRSGWFRWPLNYDPVWLVSCDGFSDKPEDRKPTVQLDPIMELLSILK